jgi:hypothetical protein
MAGRTLAMIGRPLPAVLIVGLASCRGGGPTPTPQQPSASAAPVALSTPPLLPGTAATPVATSGPRVPSSPAKPARSSHATRTWSSPGPPDGTCDAEVERSVPWYHEPGWLPLWKNLDGAESAYPDDLDASAPEADEIVRRKLGVDDCRVACAFVWPPGGPRSAYAALPAPDGKLAVYTVVLNNPVGLQCSNELSGALVEEEPVHVEIRADRNASTMVCENDAGKMVAWREGTPSGPCGSACLTHVFSAVDFFLGPDGRMVRIERHGFRDLGDVRDHIETIERSGNSIVLRGRGCTERFDLGFDGDGGP